MKHLLRGLALSSLALGLAACVTTVHDFVAPSADIDGSHFTMTQSGSALMYQFDVVMQPAADVENVQTIMSNNYEPFCGKAMLPMMEPGWQQKWDTYQSGTNKDAGFSYTYRCKTYVQLHRKRGNQWNERPTPGMLDLRLHAGGI